MNPPDATTPAFFVFAGFALAALMFMLGVLLTLMRRSEPGQKDNRPASARLTRTEPAGQKAESLMAVRQMSSVTGLVRRLAQAGFHGPSVVRSFVISKFLAAAVAAVTGLGLLLYVPALETLGGSSRFALVTLMALIGYMLPARFVNSRREEYFRRIEIAIPDALDFMLVCVEAGQSIDFAVLRVSRELKTIHPDMAAAFTSLTEALSAGADRYEAFMRLAHETENDDLRQFASIIVQSSSMGTPIADTLRVFAADLRDRRVRKVEERANVLPTKMTLGTMMFTVPPLLILLLAPALYRMATAF